MTARAKSPHNSLITSEYPIKSPEIPLKSLYAYAIAAINPEITEATTIKAQIPAIRKDSAVAINAIKIKNILCDIPVTALGHWFQA